MAGDLLSTPPPLAPPRLRGALAAQLRLIRSFRVGPTTYYRLLSEHGSAEAALEALPEVAAAAGVKSYRACSPEAAEQEMEAGRRLGADLVAHDDPHYPNALREIADAPPLCWAKGDLTLLNRPSLALVGARNASSLGTRMARKLAEELGSEGQVITSGLARGIDTAAHLAGLETGTIAVLGGGIDVTYPLENADLMRDIATKGLLVSEQPPGLQPQARHFPRRNRIISGLSQAVIVVEAAAKSGSLITARNALDQGRDVFAVPGHPFDARSWGSNMLIRDGATLVRNAADVLEAIARIEAPASPKDAPTAPVHEHIPAHQHILGLLSAAPLAEDQLIRDLGVNPREALPALTELEMTGKIARSSGGLLSLARKG